MTDIHRRSLLMGAAAAPLLAAAPVEAQAPRLLRVALAATNLNSLDPRKSVQNADQFGSRQVFDALVDPPDGTFDLDMARLQKVLVTDVTISPDSQTWTLALKRGIPFHRGMGEMTADDVVFTYRQMLDPAWASTLRNFLTNVDSVDSPEPYVVRFQLKQPDPTFHAAGLISLVGSVVSRKAVEANPDGFARSPVGSGPFVFNRMDPSRGMLLTAFNDYHGGRPRVDEVEIRYMADATARTLGFIKGDLHIIEGARLPGWLAQIRQQKPDAVVDQTRPGSVNTMFFNLNRRPFDDVRVRKALRYAIDRNVLINAFDGAAGPAWGINPPEFPGALQRDDLPAELRYDYDPDRARSLLRDAGFGGGLRFSMIMTQREDYASLMLMVQEMWRRVGVNVTIQTVDHTTYHAQKARDVNPVVMNSESFAPVSTQIPRNIYTSAATVKSDGTGGGNFSHYGAIGGGGIDALLDAAMAEPDLARRQEMVRRVELKILEDLPAFTLCTLSFFYLRQPRVNLGFDVRAGYSRYRLATATMS
jgi:peptide/nickel transport system substrate-binding protein